MVENMNNDNDKQFDDSKEVFYEYRKTCKKW